MKKILLFGAGKSATVLIDYLLKNAEAQHWEVTVADANPELARSKVGSSPPGKAVSFDINNSPERDKYISEADIIISLLPPVLHAVVAKSCVVHGKNLLTASYVDENIRSLKSEIESKELLFLCEMGLDPGIDHMSAMKIIDKIRDDGGKITSFKSHCGGLVAPESDNNPWHYKISWNPRNILMAGKDGARFKENGKEIKLSYEELFSSDRVVEIPDPEIVYLCWYPNRDSLSYIDLYGLQDAATFIRTTLRHPDFMYGWKNVVELKLTDETPQYHTDGKKLIDFFREHMDKVGFTDWLEEKLMPRFTQAKEMIENLVKLAEAEKEAKEAGEQIPESFMTADEKGNLETIKMDDIKNKAADHMAYKIHEANLTLKQLFFLGMDDEETKIDRGLCSAADVLQLALEKNLALQPEDKDMIVMLHEIESQTGSHESGPTPMAWLVRSSLVVKGEDSLHTAMAKTVGLPLGIAAKLILNGTISLKGLHLPTKKEIYGPVLKELEEHGIKFHEEIKPLK